MTDNEKKLLGYLGLAPIVDSMTIKNQIGEADSSSDQEESLSSRSKQESMRQEDTEESKKSIASEESGRIRRNSSLSPSRMPRPSKEQLGSHNES